MQAVAKWLGIVILVLGVVGLAFGILFMVMASSAKGDVLETVEAEALPVLKYDATSPTLYLVPDTGGIINTAAEIDSSADAIKDARWKYEETMGYAAITDPFNRALVEMGDGTWVDMLSLQTTLNGAQAGLGMAAMMQFVGIISIVLGVALILAGLMLHQMMAGITGVLSAMMPSS